MMTGAELHEPETSTAKGRTAHWPLQRIARTPKPYTWALILVCAIVFLRTEARASDGPQQRRSLSGVRSVDVVVEDLSDSLKTSGLSDTALQTVTELRLRSAGIRVGNEREPGTPYLYVQVTGLRDTSVTGLPLGYSAYVSVEFRQTVHLDRDNSIAVVAAVTWSDGQLVTGSSVNIVRQAVSDLADHFANSYLAANPKR